MRHHAFIIGPQCTLKTIVTRVTAIMVLLSGPLALGEAANPAPVDSSVADPFAGQAGRIERWQYLVALWLESRGDGDELLFEVNPDGVDYNIHAKLSRDGMEPLKPGVWHHLEVAGHYTHGKESWAAVRLNGTTLTWYADREGKTLIGKTWRGKALPPIKDAGWQFQVGAYGFFNKQGPPQGRFWIDDIRVDTEAPAGKSLGPPLGK
jgi:hypothetical protein